MLFHLVPHFGENFLLKAGALVLNTRNKRPLASAGDSSWRQDETATDYINNKLAKSFALILDFNFQIFPEEELKQSIKDL